jgi:two-component system, NarL family, nitrate/nitrite response regulator NarL
MILGRRALLREGIASLLQNTNYRVVVTVGSAMELEKVRLPVGRRILAIIGVDGTNGNLESIFETINLLRALGDCKVILVAETSTPIDLERVIALAPDGYIHNLASRDILIRSLELTLMNQQVFVLGLPIAQSLRDHYGSNVSIAPSEPKSPDGSRGQNPPLSQRERQVLICLAHGESNKSIARLCAITESTVKVHLKAILRKTHAQNRTQAAIWAIERGFREMALSDFRPLHSDNARQGPPEAFSEANDGIPPPRILNKIS